MDKPKQIKIEYAKVDNIKPHPQNPRKWNNDQYKRLLASIKEFGFVDPLIVNKRTMYVVGGNRRLMAGIALGYKELPVVYIDVDEARELLLNVALNDIDFGFDDQKKENVLLRIQSIIDDKDLVAKIQGIKDAAAQSAEAYNSDPEYQFSPTVHRERDYVMILFDNKTDFLNFTQSMELENVYIIDKNTKVGVGRVITYEKFLERLANLGYSNETDN